MYNLVFFSNSTDSSMVNYIAEQSNYIASRFPNITVEHVHENDARLALYSKVPRFPSIILFKNNARKSIIVAKIQTSELVDWLNTRVS